MANDYVVQIPEQPDLPYRLGRSVNHDERSRAFPFRAPVGQELHSVRWHRAVPIFDQGNLGSCTGNAAAGWLATANSLRPGLTNDAHRDGGTRIDEQYAIGIYCRATVIDPFDGEYPPTDSGSDGLSVTKVIQERGFVDSYRHAFDVDSALAALMEGPVLVGTIWRRGMFDPDARGLVQPVGDIVGGHEYLLVGYDSDRTEVLFANSWGTGWGDQGHGRMTVDTLRELLAEDGDATVPHALVAAPSDPVSPPPFSLTSLLRLVLAWLRGLAGRG